MGREITPKTAHKFLVVDSSWETRKRWTTLKLLKLIVGGGGPRKLMQSRKVQDLQYALRERTTLAKKNFFAKYFGLYQNGNFYQGT